jgi:hypothetical protein
MNRIYLTSFQKDVLFVSSTNYLHINIEILKKKGEYQQWLQLIKLEMIKIVGQDENRVTCLATYKGKTIGEAVRNIN